jgi:hypothetical protein
MKRYLYILLALPLLVVFSPLAHATDVFGFQDGKFYDVNSVLKYICFLDGNCYDLEMRPAPFKIVPISYTQPITPVDICANIEGVQTVVPIGLVNDSGNCVVPVIVPPAPAPTNTPPPAPVVPPTPNVVLTSIPVTFDFISDDKSYIQFSTDLPENSFATLINATCTTCPDLVIGQMNVPSIDGRVNASGLNLVFDHNQHSFKASATKGGVFGKSEWRFKFVDIGSAGILYTDVSVAGN